MPTSSMQGVYNAGKHRGLFSFRHGDAALFAIACGQVMYAYTVRSCLQRVLLHPGAKKDD